MPWDSALRMEEASWDRGLRSPGRHRAPRRQGSAPAGQDRLYEIDLLRITAALAVVIYHYTFSGYARHLTSISFPALSTVTRYGYLGVDMFFVISGFVVLLSAWGRRPHLTMLNAVRHIANVDVVYWTLYAEIRFYLLVFVLAWAGITRSRVIAAAWGWLAATAIVEAHVLPSGMVTTLDILVQSQWSHYFIAGMALCLIYRTGFSWQLGGILVIAYANAVYQAINFGHLVAHRYHQPFHSAVIAGVISVIFVIMTLVALRATRRLGRAWFAVAGALTYPLYLVHAYNGFVIINLVGHRVNRWALLVAMITGMGCVAYAIHRLVEVPVAPRLKRVLTRLASAADRRRPEARLAPRERRLPRRSPGAGGAEEYQGREEHVVVFQVADPERHADV